MHAESRMMQFLKHVLNSTEITAHKCVRIVCLEAQAFFQNGIYSFLELRVIILTSILISFETIREYARENYLRFKNKKTGLLGCALGEDISHIRSYIKPIPLDTYVFKFKI